MSIIYAESRFEDSRADAALAANRAAHDAICEVPHSYDVLDMLVMRWCAALSSITALILIAEKVIS